MPALPLDDAVEEVAYEVADWPVGTRLRLSSVLAERGVPSRWEPGLNLVVREDDDVRAEAVLDEIEAEELGTEGANEQVVDESDDDDEEYDDAENDDAENDDDVENDDDDGADDDGAVAQAAMADLFVAADRLIHAPENLEVAVDLDVAADVVAASPAPFGIDDATWSAIRARAADVRAALDAPESDELADGEDLEGDDLEGDDHDVVVDAVVSERAQALRDTIRPWV